MTDPLITIKHKRGTATQWTSLNPVLAEAEFGVETDTNKFKIGDGVTAWTGLAYQGGGGAAATSTVRGTVYGYTGGGIEDGFPTPSNTSLGYQSFTSGGGYDNVAIGIVALDANSSGTNNTAIGGGALANNTSGSDNISIGGESLWWNNSNRNIALGIRAMYYNTSGSDNIAIGYKSLWKNTTGFRNISIGGMGYNTTGSLNSSFGDASMVFNTTGGRNSSFGVESLFKNTTGSWNSSFGYQALYNNTTGYENTGIGYQALFYNTTGYDNTSLGYGSGNATTGYNNTTIGYSATSSSSTVSNEITLGNSSVTTLRCAVTSITSISDARDKSDISTLTFGKDFINRLNPVSFTWNTRDESKVGVKDFGFVAQDIIELEDELQAHDVLNLTLRTNPDRYEVTQGRLIPILVKAIQELSAEVEELKKQIASN